MRLLILQSRNLENGTSAFSTIPHATISLVLLKFLSKVLFLYFLSSKHSHFSGNDIITLDQTSDSLIVTYDLKSVDSTYDRPWLGIYRKDEVLSNMYEQYIYLSQQKGASRMKKLRAGEWEARLYSNAQTDVISKSNIISISK